MLGLGRGARVRERRSGLVGDVSEVVGCRVFVYWDGWGREAEADIFDVDVLDPAPVSEWRA